MTGTPASPSTDAGRIEAALVETVARAIHAADHRYEGTWEDVPDRAQGEYRAQARAAVTAAGVPAMLALAEELSTLADLNDDRSGEHAQAGREADAQYRLGRSISYGQAATKIRAALSAAVTGETTT